MYPATAVDRLLLLDAAAVGRRMVAVGERGVILISDDDGRSWRLATSPTEATLTAVYFVEATARVGGWARRDDSADRDAGETWRQVHAAPDEQKPLFAVWFESAEHGIAVGAYSSLYETLDGGNSWHPLARFEGDRHFNGLAGGPDGKVFLVGESGLIVRSDDAGRSWKTVSSPYKGSYFGVLRLGESGWLVFGLRGNVFHSSDDGEHWNPVHPAGAQAGLMGGTLLPDGGVLLVGRDGTLLESRDRGSSFTARHVPDSKALAAALSLPSGVRVVVGEGGATRLEAGG